MVTPAPALSVLRAAQHAGELVHLEHIPGRAGQTTSWPDSVRADVAAALAARGVEAPWTHQAQAAALARAGQNVIIATRAASGKSAGYLAAALSEVLDGGTVLYIAPTKALAADQLHAVQALGVPGVRATCYDGDSTAADRAWAQAHANYLLTNPDMLHSVMLPNHTRWRGFFKRLRVVIIDECHNYRGVCGSHVAQVLRRLSRVAAHQKAGGQPPVFMLASATIAEPAAGARLLTGLAVVAVTDDGSPRAPLTFALWEPPLLHTLGDIRSRRAATKEAADLLAALVKAEVPALAFIRSRRGAETVALNARTALGADQGEEVAAYRSGYLADDRRHLEAGLRDGRITGMAATTALELGVNIPALDAVLIAGWPGTWASLWQQAGRAGRAGRPATAVFIARDDPLDTYLIHHPDTLLHHALEPAVLDPANPYVLGPHLGAAAAELPLTEADLCMFGPAAEEAGEALTKAGELRKRQSGWHPARGGGRAGPCRGGDARPPGRHHGRAVRAPVRPRRRRLPAPGRDLPGRQAGPARPGGAGGVPRPRLQHPGSRRHRHRRDGGAPSCPLGGGGRGVRRGAGDTAGGGVHTRPFGIEKKRGGGGAAASAADPSHGRCLVDYPERPRGSTRRPASRRRGARGRARFDRDAATVRHLRPVGRGGHVDRMAPGHRPADRLRLRRPRGRRRLRGTGLRRGARLAHRHKRRHRLLPLRNRLPLVRPVPQMRQRQQPLIKGRRGNPPRHPPSRSTVTTRSQVAPRRQRGMWG